MDTDNWEDNKLEFQYLLNTSTIINLPTVSILESNKNINLFTNIFEKTFPKINFTVVQRKSAISDILMMDLKKENKPQILKNSEKKDQQFEDEKFKAESNPKNFIKNSSIQISDQNSTSTIFKIRKPRKMLLSKIKPIVWKPGLERKDEEGNSTSPSPEVMRAVEEDITIDYQNYYQQYSDWINELQKEEDEREESSTKMLHRLRMSNNYTPLSKVPKLAYEDNFEK